MPHHICCRKMKMQEMLTLCGMPASYWSSDVPCYVTHGVERLTGDPCVYYGAYDCKQSHILYCRTRNVHMLLCRSLPWKLKHMKYTHISCISFALFEVTGHWKMGEYLSNVTFKLVPQKDGLIAKERPVCRHMAPLHAVVIYQVHLTNMIHRACSLSLIWLIVQTLDKLQKKKKKKKKKNVLGCIGKMRIWRLTC